MYYIKHNGHAHGENAFFFVASSNFGSTEKFREKLLKLCKSACGDKGDAVYKALTDRYVTVGNVARSNHMSERALLNAIHNVLHRAGDFDGWRLVSGDDYKLIARFWSASPEVRANIEQILAK